MGSAFKVYVSVLAPGEWTALSQGSGCSWCGRACVATARPGHSCYRCTPEFPRSLLSRHGLRPGACGLRTHFRSTFHFMQWGYAPSPQADVRRAFFELRLSANYLKSCYSNYPFFFFGLPKIYPCMMEILENTKKYKEAG